MDNDQFRRAVNNCKGSEQNNEILCMAEEACFDLQTLSCPPSPRHCQFLEGSTSGNSLPPPALLLGGGLPARKDRALSSPPYPEALPLCLPLPQVWLPWGPITALGLPWRNSHVPTVCFPSPGPFLLYYVQNGVVQRLMTNIQSKK